MKTNCLRVYGIWLLGLFLLGVLGGCASVGPSATSAADTQLLRLKAISAGEPPAVSGTGKSTAVVLETVNVPGYITQAAAGTRDPRTASYGPTDEWLATLKREIPIVVWKNLATLLAPRGISVVRGGKDVKGEYGLSVDLKTFEITRLDILEAKVEWVLRGGAAKSVMYKEKSMSKAVKGQDLDTKDAVMSEALADISKAIAETVSGAIK